MIANRYWLEFNLYKDFSQLSLYAVCNYYQFIE